MKINRQNSIFAATIAKKLHILLGNLKSAT